MDVASLVDRMMTHSTPICLMVALITGLLAVTAVPAGLEAKDLNQIDSTDPSISSVSARDLPISMLLKQARECLNKNQLSPAEELYQMILIREPDHVEAMLDLATVYERMGRLEYARGLMLRASALEFNNESVKTRSREISNKLSTVLHQEVDSLISAKQYDYAIPKISVLLTLEPESARLYYEKALCHYHVNRLEVALKDIEIAIKLSKEISFYQLRTEILERVNEKTIHSLVKQAGTLLDEGTPEANEEAMVVVSKVLQLDPDNVWAKRQFIALHASEAAGQKAADGWQEWQLIQYLRMSGPFLLRFSETLYQHIGWLCLILLILLVYNSPFIRMTIKGFPTQATLSGRLAQFKINEILTFLNWNERTGTLRIIGTSVNGSIYFENGDALHCEANHLMGKEALNYILKNAKKGRFAFSETKAPVKRTIDVPLNLILMGLSNRKSSPGGRKTKKPPSRIKQLLDNHS